jgi:hypothetical protein
MEQAQAGVQLVSLLSLLVSLLSLLVSLVSLLSLLVSLLSLLSLLVSLLSLLVSLVSLLSLLVSLLSLLLWLAFVVIRCAHRGAWGALAAIRSSRIAQSQEGPLISPLTKPGTLHPDCPWYPV